MFKLSKIAYAMSVVGAVALAGAAQAELVTNGGFETGDFTGWTQFGNQGDTGVDCTGRFTPHSGQCVGFFGAIGSTGGIFQTTLATQAGQTYDVSFWYSNLSGGTPNSFEFNWDGGRAEVSMVNAAAFGYTQYTAQLTASGTNTDLRFTIRHDPNFYLLDDVSVVARNNNVPEPGSMALVGLALAGLGAMSRRKRAG
jgi:hypothetical protein